MDRTRQSEVKDDFFFEEDNIYIRERYWRGLVSQKLKMTLSLRKTIYILERDTGEDWSVRS